MDIIEYEELLEEVLRDVRDDVDKREGSIIYDAIAPMTYYLAEQRKFIKELKDEAFIDTARGSFLDRLCLSYGITRKEETKSKRLIKTNKEVDIGKKFTKDNLTYIITKKLEKDYEYEAECEEYGTIGNIYKGEMESEDRDISATLLGIIEAGIDEEDDDSLRKRLYLKIRRPATSGNIYHYMNWALEVNGVKEAKVIPLENGAGTVSIMIYTDIEDEKIVERVKENIDKKRPIGATVNVYKPSKKIIDISANISLRKNELSSKVQADIEREIKSYLKGLIFSYKPISYAKISSIILEIDGVEDFENLLINGSTKNIQVGDKEIAELGKLELRF